MYAFYKSFQGINTLLTRKLIHFTFVNKKFTLAQFCIQIVVREEENSSTLICFSLTKERATQLNLISAKACVLGLLFSLNLCQEMIIFKSFQRSSAYMVIWFKCSSVNVL